MPIFGLPFLIVDLKLYNDHKSFSEAAITIANRQSKIANRQQSAIKNRLMLEQDKWPLFYAVHRREESPGSAGQDAG